MGGLEIKLWDELLGETGLIQDGPPRGGSGALLMQEGFLKIAQMGEKELRMGTERGAGSSISATGTGWAQHSPGTAITALGEPCVQRLLKDCFV